MTLLTLVQGASRKVGQAPPTAVVGQTDETTQRMLALAQDEGRELASYGDWRVLRKEKTFTTAATEDQAGQTPIPTDLDAFIDDTFWNRSARRRLYGPMTVDEWQAYKSQSSSPVTDGFYLRGTSWLMMPVPLAGQTIAYEYRSKNWCQSNVPAGQDKWLADTDTGILSEVLMELGLVWRYKQSRGLDWQTDYDKYMFQVQTRLAKDQPRRTISMVDCGYHPILSAPEGSWVI